MKTVDIWVRFGDTWRCFESGKYSYEEIVERFEIIGCHFSNVRVTTGRKQRILMEK